MTRLHETWREVFSDLCLLLNAFEDVHGISKVETIGLVEIWKARYTLMAVETHAELEEETDDAGSGGPA